MCWEPQDVTVSKVRYEELERLEEIFQSEFGDEPNMETVRMRLKCMRSFYYLLLPLCRISPWLRERFNVYVIRVRENFAGFIQLSLAGSRRLHLDFIAIARAYRGRGIGSYILRGLCNEFVDPKAYEMLLEVRVDNPARHLYAALGFCSVAQILHYERSFVSADAAEGNEKAALLLSVPQGHEEAQIAALCKKTMPENVAAVLGESACMPIENIWRRSLHWLKNLSLRCKEQVYILKDIHGIYAAIRMRSYVQIANHSVTLFLEPEREGLRRLLLQEIVRRLARAYGSGNLHTTIYDEGEGKRNALEQSGFTQSEAYILMHRSAATFRKNLQAVDKENLE